jgi:tetratricopeptide (TPR) repeat protein
MWKKASNKGYTRMKRVVTILTLMSLTLIVLFLANQSLLLAKPSVMASDTMSTANHLYDTGQFSQAAQAYQQLVDQGFADSALFYNLGNAYFKQGDYGRAVLNYRRAEQLAPRDADIKANLDLARTQTVDQAQTAESNEGLLGSLGHWTQQWLTVNELAIAVLMVWVLFVLLMIIFSHIPKATMLREGMQYLVIMTALVLIAGIASLGSRTYLANTQPEAVVLAQEVNVTSGPGPNYVTQFNLHNGAEVRLLESRGNWTRLALAEDNLQGWVPANTLETVN